MISIMTVIIFIYVGYPRAQLWVLCSCINLTWFDEYAGLQQEHLFKTIVFNIAYSYLVLCWKRDKPGSREARLSSSRWLMRSRKQTEELIKEPEQEITELKWRSTELERLPHTEEHLHLLQVTVFLHVGYSVYYRMLCFMYKILYCFLW